MSVGPPAATPSAPVRHQSASGVRSAGVAIVVGAVYFATARLGLLLEEGPGAVATVWLPAGILFAALAARPPSQWPPVVGACFVASLGADVLEGNPWLPGLGFATANCIESMAAAAVLRRFGGVPPRLDRTRHVLVLVGLAAGASNAATALLGATVDHLAFGSDLARSWAVWWAADGTAILLVAPLVLAWAPLGQVLGSSSVRRAVELATLLFGLAVVSLWVFRTSIGDSYIYLRAPYLVVPFLLWAAFRFGTWGVAVAIPLPAAIALWSTAADRGPFAVRDLPTGEHELGVQVFLATLSATGLLLAAVIAERRRAEARELARLQRATGHQAALLELALSQWVERAPFEEAVRAVTETAGRSLGVERASVWLLDKGGEELQCVDLYQLSTEAHSKVPPLAAHAYRRYFEALRSGLAIDAVEAARDPRTRELAESYIEPLGISSMLDAGVLVEGKVVGVVCHEAIGSVRRWESDEVSFASEVASWVARLLERRARRWAEDRYRTMVDQAVVGMYVADDQGRLLDANPALASMLGYTSPSELLGLNLRDDVYADPEDRDRLLARIETDGLPHELEVDWRRKDGPQVRVRLRGRVERDAHQQVQRFEMVAEDVTERRRLEEQLAQSQKLEAIGRLAGGVAHDFNNLLTAILGYAQLLEFDLAVGDPRIQHVDQISRAARRAAQLTRQLLTFSRRQLTAPERLDLNAVVDRATEMLSRLVGEDVQLETKLGDGLPAIRADPAQIEQVLLNLTVNARDAMPEGGRLLFETRSVAIDDGLARLHIGLNPGRQYALLEVSDTGTGMDRETLDHLYEPFFTTKTDGSGLGLAIVHGVAEQAGGTIAVYSEPGKGTTFKIYLPAAEGHGAAAETSLHGPPKGGSEAVLLVEDEVAVRTLSSEALELYGYRVVDFGDPELALEWLEANPETSIDLLLADLVMPGMKGAELARRARELRPRLPILFMSGYSAGLTSDEIDELGDFLPKPFSPTALARRVRDTLDRRSTGP